MIFKIFHKKMILKMSYLNEYKELMVQLLEREKKLQDLMIKTEILKQKIENVKYRINYYIFIKI